MFDYIIIGGGIVGLSTAWQFKAQLPHKQILLLEKEDQLASHQTGHNSGVIHAGIYYTPGSLKAEFCRAGLAATIKFCRENEIPFEQCGKLLVATCALEQQRMQDLFQRAGANGLDVELLDAQQLKTLEPAITGVGAILLKTTGIVDFRQVTLKMAERFLDLGGQIRLNTKITGLQERTDKIDVVTTDGGSVSTRFLVTCTGLMADRTTRMLGIPTDFRIIPFRGEYYRLRAEKSTTVSHLIYPIPDPGLPFLGVHLTRTIDGSIIVGPNAVQGWEREGYSRLNFDLRDTWDLVSFPGFWRVLVSNFRAGLTESVNAVWKRGYLRQVQKYCPSLGLDDLQDYPPGVRAQAVLKDGTLVDDFLFAQSPRSLHVCNAPSPAATSAIPIGAHICSMLPDGVDKH